MPPSYFLKIHFNIILPFMFRSCRYKPDQSIPCPHHTSWKSLLILFSHLRLGLVGRFFPSGFPTKLIMNLLSPLHVLNLRDPYPNHLISFWSDWVKRMEKGLPVLQNLNKNETVHLASMFSLSLLYPRDDISNNRSSSTNRCKIFYNLWCLLSFPFNG